MSPSRRRDPAGPAAHGDAPGPPGTRALGAGVACPHCGSTDVRVEAPFGSQLMTSQYWCRGCRTVFERLKVEPDEAPGRWLE